MKLRTFGRLALCVLFSLAGGLATAAPLDDAKDSLAQRRYEQAVKQFLPVANSGNAEAQRLLGEMIFRGQGVNADANAAFVWTKLAAEGRDFIAQYNLGYMFENGFGTSRSDDEALRWYRRSAEGRNVLAYRRLGDWYLDSNANEAMRWYDLARLAGDDVSAKKFAALSVEDQRQREESRQAQIRENTREQQAMRDAQVRDRQEAQRAFSNALSRDLGQLQQQQSTQAARIGAASRGTTVEAEQARAEREAEFAARVRPAEARSERRAPTERPGSATRTSRSSDSDDTKTVILTRTDADERAAAQKADNLRREADAKKRTEEMHAQIEDNKRKERQAVADDEARREQMCRTAPPGACGCGKYRPSTGNACSK